MLMTEKILTFSEAARRLPKVGGKRPHPSTIWRWGRKGLHGIRLETRRVGGRFVTSEEALERFTKELAEIEPPSASIASSPLTVKGGRSEAAREKAIADADARLIARGCKR